MVLTYRGIPTESLTIDTPRADSPLWALNGHAHNPNKPRGDDTKSIWICGLYDVRFNKIKKIKHSGSTDRREHSKIILHIQVSVTVTVSMRLYSICSMV